MRADEPQCQRYQIDILLKSGKSQKEIAEAAWVYRSAISKD
jgi:hypothetical protein